MGKFGGFLFYALPESPARPWSSPHGEMAEICQIIFRQDAWQQPGECCTTEVRNRMEANMDWLMLLIPVKLAVILLLLWILLRMHIYGWTPQAPGLANQEGGSWSWSWLRPAGLLNSQTPDNVRFILIKGRWVVDRAPASLLWWVIPKLFVSGVDDWLEKWYNVFCLIFR